MGFIRSQFRQRSRYSPVWVSPFSGDGADCSPTISPPSPPPQFSSPEGLCDRDANKAFLERETTLGGAISGTRGLIDPDLFCSPLFSLSNRWPVGVISQWRWRASVLHDWGIDTALMAHHQQPYDPYYPHQPGYGFNDRNAISTVFVSGLPDDVKAREIHNLFRHRPGFDYCQLKYTGRGNQVVAFATFVNHQSAMTALHALNGAKFDPQTGSTLHIELARSNSIRKHKPGSEAYVVIDKRSQAATDTQATSSDDGDSESDEPNEQNNTDSGNNDDSGIAKSGEGAVDDSGNTVAAENDGAQPCSTLFIANLGPNCTEDELKDVLSQYPGFNSIKVRDRGGMPVAFADYEEIEQATEVMDALQGSSLPSSDRGGMHIEYARSKMRKP